VEKWTQSVDAMPKCGSKNDCQNRATTTHNFLYCENGKVMLLSLPATSQELEVLLISKERSVVKSQNPICMYNSMLAFTSLGAKVNESVTRGIGPYSFHV